MSQMRSWHVFQDEKYLDTVYYVHFMQEDQVKETLIEQEGFEQDINIVEASCN